MIPPDLPNPFHANPVLKDTFAVPPGHVPELHAPVLATIHQVLASCRSNGSPTSVLVRGEAGSGKTHLLAQLRDDLKADPTTLVLGVSFFGAYPGGIWRRLRAAMVGDLLRTPSIGAANGLTRILHARYPQWGTPKKGASLLDVILGQNASPQLTTFLAREPDLSAALRSVLAKLYDPASAGIAADWLKGEVLGDAALTALGLPLHAPSDRELEATARDVVLTLCRLAGDKTTLVFGFDNVETVQATLVDGNALREVAWVIGELATGNGPRVVLTFLRPETLVTLRKAADKPAVQRIASVEAEISWLGKWEHVARLVAAQFEASPPWRELRKQNPDPYWPLGEPFLRQLIAKHKFALTPRHLLGACRVQLERLRTGGATSTKPPETRERQPTSFDTPWQKRRDKFIAQPAALTFDTVVSLGLPWLREAVEAPLELFEHQVDTLPDVNVLFRPAAGGPMLGVSCCDHEPARLWRRLDRLKKQWSQREADGLLGSLVLLRRSNAPLTPVAEERIKGLKQAGVAVVYLPREQYAELAAYQRIFADTQAGNYTDFGRPVTVEEFAAWARDHLSSAVKELADTLFGGTTSRRTGRKPALSTKS